MKKFELTNEEVAKKWRDKKFVYTIELGGLGLGYEQALQEYLFDVFTYLTENKIDIDTLVENGKYTEKFEKIADDIAKGRDLSYAMYGIARGTAFQFHRYGYAYMMNTVPKDRIIIQIIDER